MEKDYIQEERYLKAQKRIKEIKGFYSHVVVTILVIPFLIFINLRFSPHFHWFWFPIFGLGFSLVIHWLTVFGFGVLGLGRDWEDRKIKEMMEEENKRKY